MCQPIYRKPAQGWLPSRKSFTCCSTRLFLRNNPLYSELYRNPSAPSEVNSNTGQHTNNPHSKNPDASWLLGRSHTYHGNTLLEAPVSSGVKIPEHKHVPGPYHGEFHTCTYPTGRLLTMYSHQDT